MVLICLICSNTQRKEAEREREVAKAKVVPPPPPQTPMGANVPKEGSSSKKLDFNTPKQQAISPTSNASLGTDTPLQLTPQSSEYSPVSTTSSSTLTPSIAELGLGHCRGRPHKQLQEVDYSDFPTTGSREEQHRWYLKKRTENWQYNKLTGPDAAKYCQAENL